MGTQSNSFDIAFTEIKKLVDKFKQGEKHYLSPSYNETEVRKDFIDKFFIALSWDVNHDIQQDPYQQEVKVEKTQDNQKRTDYTFYLSPNFKDTKFYVEAKKPSQNLRNSDYYFQTIRYGWNSKTPIAVLTDFEEFHILDCRIRPDINKVLDGFHKQYYYKDYLEKEKFSEIYYLFSHESVFDGSLERYADSLPKPKGKATEKGFVKSKLQSIDEEFLEYIDSTRESLAKAFKKNDENLGSEELTEATQRTIDRLVFIRFLEDKLIEQDNYVSEFGKSNKAWTDFITVCRRLDSKYNGIVFKKHFIDEQNFRGPELNEFKNICSDISHLNSPYDFNAIPIHILGSIYERFLGKVVHATDKRVKVEEKPEVRKAGGVYYTPKYIVDYIVDNTIGKILRNEKETLPSRDKEVELAKSRLVGRVGGVSSSTLVIPAKAGIQSSNNVDTEKANSKTPEESTPLIPKLQLGNAKGKTPAEISKLRFADIACGSGSFLIGVFETLLDYHNKYYQQHKAQAKKDGCIEKDGIMVLSIKQKQNILLKNIYGVDIDQQAVEVTQLSLALKMLEDETTATANDMQVLFHEKILPDLSKNIICGNSLIGTDILSGSMFASEDERKLNPMDFETTFPDIIKNGGFDTIVGNPPYVNAITLTELFKRERDYLDLSEYYNTLFQKWDLYIAFIERGLKLLGKHGSLSMIIPYPFVNQLYAKNSRKFIIENFNLREIADVSDKKIFKDAIINNCIIFIDKKIPSNSVIITNLIDNKFTRILTKKYNELISNSETCLWNTKTQTIAFVNKATRILGELCFISKGMVLNSDEFKAKSLFKKEDLISNESSPIYIKKYIEAKDIGKYKIKRSRWLEWNTKRVPSLISRPTFPELYEQPKILINKIGELKATLDTEKFYCDQTIRILVLWRYLEGINNNSINNSVKRWYKVSRKELVEYSHNYKYQYLLGILNSKIGTNLIDEIRGKGNIDINPEYLKNIPIPEIDFTNSHSIFVHDKIVNLVDQMLESKKQLQLIKTDKDKTYYERKCDTLDKQIDSEVYKLYGLTEEEIKIVEGK